MKLASDQKLAFHPTDLLEAYRTVVITGQLVTRESSDDPDYLYAANNFTHPRGSYYNHYCIFEYLLQKGRFDLIDKIYRVKYDSGQRAVLDPFAGEGDWLNLFNKFTKATTVAIEIDPGRCNKILADYKQNCAFEDAEIPKNSISAVLFNPPYGSSNGVRNVRRYLEMLLEKEVLADSGALIAVIRGDDLLECSDVLFNNFNLENFYRVNDAEFSKYKQYVLYFRKISQYYGAYNKEARYIAFQDSLQKIVNDKQKFTLDHYVSSYWLPSVKFDSAYKIQEKKKKFEYSTKDKVWDWAIKDINAKIGDDFELTMPRAPKVSELANILASGVINGAIDDTDFPHIVSGGVKKVYRRESVVVDTNDGPMEKIKETKLSKPFINVLYKKHGKIVIKEIQGED